MISPVLAQGNVTGPTWERGADGLFILPELTLGWAVIDWCEAKLLQPDGPDAGEPWKFTKEQQRFVLWWYAINADGRFVYRSGMLRRMKGWGKDPLAAVLCCVELLGPCRFQGWSKDGTTKTVPHYAACVQVAAVSQDQVKRNTMSLFPALLSSAVIREYELDVGKEIIYAFHGRCRIELLATSARSAEGPRPTFILKNETQHWLPSNGGDEMSEVCARNAAKSRDGSTRVLSISNAHAPGELSDAELDYEGHVKGAKGFLYDSIEADQEVIGILQRLKSTPDLTPTEMSELREALLASLAFCRGDSVWLDLQRLLDECEDPRTQLNTALRFYFNRLAASEERAFNRNRWDALRRDGYKVAPGAWITLGFDGSVNDDWSALIGTEIETGFQWPVGIWEPRLGDDGSWSIDVNEVNATVDEALSTWQVWRLNADPYYWMEQLSAWAGRYNKPGGEVVVSFSTTNLKPTALAVLAYRNAIEAGEVSHDGDERFGAAIGNCHKRMLLFLDDKEERMFVLQKERPGSPQKIDPAMAAVLSWWARLAAISLGVLNDDDGEPSMYEDEDILIL